MEKVVIQLIADIVEKDGHKRLAFKNPDYYRDQINRLNDKKKVVVTIQNQSSSRSLRQNAYWHGACFPILAEITGFTQMEVKELCKKKFIKPKIATLKGKEYEIPVGTSQLTKYDGVQFTDDIRALAVELGGYIPTPAEAGYAIDDQPLPEEHKLPEYPSDYKDPLI